MPNYLLSARVLWDLIPGDRHEAAPVKARFVAAIPDRTTWASAIGIAWVRSELEKIQDLFLRKEASDAFEQHIAPRYANRVLKLDDGVLRLWGTLRAIEVKLDSQCSTETALEAATAKHHGYIYVGRYHPLFDLGKVLYEDPWQKL
jgi:hypothetical protein